ncbi:hypothetical protein PROVRETT_09459 [Providencia rettgeri DSM 1131]|uniref:hypothetical protein n=1 Tax=Providencia rettgeri TaxID=587 RepID=UPI0001C34704|nr:hypothetical protein [Providencia rettgeri]EFE51868.1 hypothetical protein PROVRETT_09459 [Providencia rettgeri DSM 1131]QXA58856.1 hypothetical protein I6L79_04680 [Providencia rettgeri]
MLNLNKKNARNKSIYISLLVVLCFYFFNSKSRAFVPGINSYHIHTALNLQGESSRDITTSGASFEDKQNLYPYHATYTNSMYLGMSAKAGVYTDDVRAIDGGGGEWKIPNTPFLNNLGVMSESVRFRYKVIYEYTSLDTGYQGTFSWSGPGICETSNPSVISVSCSGDSLSYNFKTDESYNVRIITQTDYLSYRIDDVSKLYKGTGLNSLSARSNDGILSLITKMYSNSSDGASQVLQFNYRYGIVGGGCSINVNPIVVDFKTISNYSEQELASISDVSLGNVNCTWDKVERPYYRFNIDMNGLPELKNENNDVLGIVKGSLHGQATCTDDGLVSSQGQIYQNNANGDVLSSWVLCKKAGIPYPNAGEYTASGTMNIYLP